MEKAVMCCVVGRLIICSHVPPALASPHFKVKLRKSTIVDCHWVLQEEQSLLLVGCKEIGKEEDESLYKRLQAVSTVWFNSPMFRLCYGGSQYGQYSACTVDMMHAFEHGVLVYVLKAFVEPISGPKCKLINRLVRVMFANHRCSKKDTYPRTYFSKGVTHLKLVKCYEWAGFILVYLILAQSYKGSLLLKYRMDDNESNFAKKNERRDVQTKKKLDKIRLL
jgi:hypothetical protein